MYLAVLVSPENPCPPTAYGGAERRAAIIVERLLEQGHAVDLYCGPNSRQHATRRFLASSPSMSKQEEYLRELFRLSCLNFRYDCCIDLTPHHIVSSLGCPPYLSSADLEKPYPVVSIMGGDPLKKYPHDEVRNRVYVSREFAEFCGCPDHPVLHNVVHPAPEAIPLGKGGGGYALYVGVVRPEKGVLEAERACASVGIPLKVAGPIRDFDYWDRFRDRVEYLGILPNNDEVRSEVFGKADVFVYAPLWCDAGPLAPMEAMLYGTPVAGFAVGGLASDVEDGVGGWLVREGIFAEAKLMEGPPNANVRTKEATRLEMSAETIQRLADAIEKALLVERKGVRESILPKVDPERHVAQLMRLVTRAAKGEEW